MMIQYKKLLKDQKDRGVIFSSQLKGIKGETANGELHEVFSNEVDKDEKIKNLSDATFFEDSSWNVNEIRQ